MNIVLGDCISVHDGKAETIINAIVKFMDSYGIESHKLVGFASDGASVMTGRLTGVATRLKNMNPNVITVHCAAHRLALAAYHAASSFQQLKDFQTTITQLYYFFENSAVRYERLGDLQKIMKAESKKFKKPTSVMWLSLQEAVDSVHKSWSVLVAVLEDDWIANKTPQAKGLSQKVNTYAFLAKVCVVLDVLEPLGKLSKVLQKEVIDVDQMHRMLSATISTLNAMREVDGPVLQSTDCLLQTLNPTVTAKRAIGSLKKRYVRQVVTEINKRLPQTSLSMLDDLNEVLNPAKLPMSAQGMNAHGHAEVDRICTAYETGTIAVIDQQRLKHDYFQFKGYLNSERGKSLSTVCHDLLQHKDDYPDFCTLAQIMLCLPLTSVPCERGFSFQNRIKNRLRNRLLVENLAQKMKIKAARALHIDLLPKAVHNFETQRKRVLFAPS